MVGPNKYDESGMARRCAGLCRCGFGNGNVSWDRTLPDVDCYEFIIAGRHEIKIKALLSELKTKKGVHICERCVNNLEQVIIL